MRKQFVKCLLGLVMAISPCILADHMVVSAQAANEKINAIVDGQYAENTGAEEIKVYKTIEDALRAAPAASNNEYVILIKAGKYYEKLTVDKPNIKLLGESRDNTIVYFDAAADTKGPDGKPYTTFGSATLTVAAERFSAENITIENSFDYLTNLVKPIKDTTRLTNYQAVALKTDKGSDQTVLKNCKILGYQDTLFVSDGRQYFKNCYIAGNVDFIFGAGKAVFEKCDIISRTAGSDTHNGYITAASTPLSNPYGFLFVNCRLLKENADLPDGSVTLGRPWHPTTNLPDGTRQGDPNAVGSVVFKNCYMDSHIPVRGWDPMYGTDTKGKKSLWFYPQESRFYEYRSTGPGAASSNETRRMLSDQEAGKYTIEKVLEGWNPQ